MTDDEVTGRSALREQAIGRLEKRRDFGVHVLVYCLVNGFLSLIWVMTDPHGFFWPIFPMAGWGIGLVLNAWTCSGAMVSPRNRSPGRNGTCRTCGEIHSSRSRPKPSLTRSATPDRFSSNV
jgi:2TM domain